jgi:NitT/TauT family transport system ATP-binding protein
MGTIQFSSVCKTYPGGVMALENVDFTVGEGEFVALLGPSGCGKSTLLNLIAGFETLSDGRMSFNGQSVTKPGPDRGVVFQEASLLPWLNVWENVVFGPKVQNTPRDVYEPRAREILRVMGLEKFHETLPVQLSGGMRQRVGIARALVMQPKALLMDEPFGALDAQTRLSMQELLLDIWQSLKTTVLFVTHDIDEAILLADRVCVMTARPGRITRDIRIEIPRPRSIDTLTSGDFTTYKAMIMAEMRGLHAHR